MTPVASLERTDGVRSSAFSWILLLVLLCAGCLTVYWPLTSLPTTAGLLGVWDMFTAYGPWLYFTDHRIHDGEFPLWNPLSFCGEPFAANPQNLLFYPPNLVRSLLTFDPTPFRTHIGFWVLVVLHVMVGGVGTAAWSRNHGMSWAGSWLAAFVFITSSQYVERLVRHPTFILTIAWLPWMLLAAQRVQTAQNRRQKFRMTVAAGILFGLIALGGFPQLVIYSAVALCVYWVSHALLFADRTPTGQRKYGVGNRVFETVWPLIMMLSIGAGLSAVTYLSTYEFGELSARGKGLELVVEDYLHNVYSPSRIARSFLVYPGLDQSSLKIAGTAAVLLALAASWHPSRRTTLLFAVLLYAFIDCAIGSPMPVAFLTETFAPFRIVYPDYACLFACLPLAVLAGLGFDALRVSKDPPLLRLAVLVSAALIVWAAFAHSDDIDIQPNVLAILLPAALLVALGIAVTGRFSKAVAGAAFVMVLFEPAVWTQSFIPHHVKLWSAPPFELDRLQTHRPFWSDNRRGATYLPNDNLYDMVAVINGYNPLFIERTYQVVAPADMEDTYTWWLQLEVVQVNPRGYLFLKRPFWIVPQAVQGGLPPKGRLFPAANTVFMSEVPDSVVKIDREALPNSGISANRSVQPVVQRGVWDEFASDQYLDLHGMYTVDYEIANLKHPGKHSALSVTIEADGVVLVSGSVTEISSGREHVLRTARAVSNNDRAANAHLLLPDLTAFNLDLSVSTSTADAYRGIVGLDYVIDESDENASITIVERRANRVRLNVGPLPAPRILLFTESRYPGWKALVDGKRVPILEANDAFMAVELPAGTHEVEFMFRPWRVKAGLAISLTILASAVAALFVLRTRQHNT